MFLVVLRVIGCVPRTTVVIFLLKVFQVVTTFWFVYVLLFIQAFDFSSCFSFGVPLFYSLLSLLSFAKGFVMAAHNLLETYTLDKSVRSVKLLVTYSAHFYVCGFLINE